MEDPQFAESRKTAGRILQAMQEQLRITRDLLDRSRSAIEESRLALNEAPDGDDKRSSGAG